MAKIKQLNVALLGLGTVGKGLVSLLKENEAEILNKHGAKVNIVKIFERNADKLEKFGLDRNLFTDSMNFSKPPNKTAPFCFTKPAAAARCL